MIERPGTWGEVEQGVTILAPNQRPLYVVRTAETKKGRWLLVIDHLKNEFRISPKPSGGPVSILEMTDEEAELVVTEKLGAHRILDAERERRMPERAKLWIVPPFPAKGRGALDHARTHVEWYHGGYAGEAQYAGGFTTLKQIREAHSQMHDQQFMDMPHTHEGDNS